MTREEAIAELNTFKISAKSELGENALDMAIKALEQTRWIPVNERLPDSQKHGDKDFSDWVEVTILIGINKKDAYVGEAYYCFSENKWYAKRFVVGEVIAWMPLSKPYKAEREVKNGRLDGRGTGKD